jgi:hypothetical protein
MEKIEIEEFFAEMRRIVEVQIRQAVGVLVEHYDDKIKLVVEQYDGIAGHMGNMERKLDSHTEMIGELAEDVFNIKEDIKILKGDAAFLRADTLAIKNKLDVKGDKRDVVLLDRRVQALEREK